jgi:hypothetical protein
MNHRAATMVGRMGDSRKRGMTILFSILLGTATGQAGGSWGGYSETIALDRDGSAIVTVHFQVLAGTSGDTLALPYAFSTWPDSFAYSENIAAVLTHATEGSRRVLVVLGTTIVTAETLEIRFRLSAVTPIGGPPPGDFGNYTLTYRAVNRSPASIDRYAVTLELPEGFVFTDVVSTTPSRPANGAGSPYVLGMRQGRHSMTLQDTTVAQGDVIALQVQARDGRKSPWLIVALVLLGGAYLIWFRDLVVS